MAAGIVPVRDRTELVNASQQVPVFLTENGREGIFEFDPSDLSAQVTADPTQVSYIPPDGNGRRGAWVRRGAVTGLNASTRGALALLGTSLPVILSESGREGIFVFSSADLSAEVAADTEQGIYVAPASDATGASGAWVRSYSGAANVKWFGATGDGTTDDTATCQAALDACAGVCALRVPAGTYMIDTTVNSMPFPWYGGIQVPSNTRLVLEENASFEAISNANPKYMVLSLYDADNVVITGGLIVGDRDTHTYPNLFDTLAELNAGDYRTKAGYGSWAPADGMVAYVYADGGNDGTYTYNAGAWSKTGVLPTTSPDVYYTHEFGYGISVFNSRNVRIDKVRISNFTGDCIFIGQDSGGPLTQGVFVTNCDLTGARRQGISIVRGSDIVITGNRMHDIGQRLNLQDGTSPRCGIDIESGSLTKSDNVLIADNVFTDCAGGSVDNFDGNQVTITGNVMGEDCTISYGFAAGCTISSNVLQSAGIGGSGARTQASFTYTQTGTVVTATFAAAHTLTDGQNAYLQFLDANSRVVSAGYFPVTVVSSTVITADIDAALTLTSGNGLRGHPANNVIIIGNSLYGGYINVTGKGFVVSGNILRDCPGTGMLVAAATSDSIILGNAIDVASYGIRILDGATNVRVDGNRISGCNTRAIDGSALIVNNSITNCAGGIFTSSTVKATVRGNSINLSGWTGSGTSIEAKGSGVRHEITDNIVSAALSHSIFIQSPSLIANNRVIGFTYTIGINANGANANGARIVGNYVESARVGAGTVGVYVNGAADSVRVIGNTITYTGSAYSNAIDTSAGTNNKITNNVNNGTVNKAATDTETGTVAY